MNKATLAIGSVLSSGGFFLLGLSLGLQNLLIGIMGILAIVASSVLVMIVHGEIDAAAEANSKADAAIIVCDDSNED